MVATPLPKTFHIIYGWTEGKWHARHLITILEQAGLKQSSSIHEADIVIAHSAGCFIVPKTLETSLILFVGLPFWPGKSLLRRLIEKVQLDASSPYYTKLSWAHKFFWNTTYFITKPFSTIRLWRASSRPNALLTLPVRAIVVLNHQDSFCIPNITDYIENEVIALPGLHDDVWMNPEPYVRLMRSRYE